MSRRRKTSRANRAAATSIQPVTQHVTTMEEIDKMPALLDTEQAAAILGQTTAFVAKACASGTYPAIKIGNSWRINKERFLQMFGLIDDGTSQEKNDMSVQETIPIGEDMPVKAENIFDLSGAISIKSGRGHKPAGVPDGSYIYITTNGYKKGTNKKLEAITLSIQKSDADRIIKRYGTRIGIKFVPDLQAIVITDGIDRAMTSSGKSMGRRTISLSMFKNELKTMFDRNKYVDLRMNAYDNCFVFTPVGEFVE